MKERMTNYFDENKKSVKYGFASLDAVEFPPYLMFDITNHCNSKCVHCPQSSLYSDNKQARTYLDFEVFKKAIDEASGRKLDFIRITADGEPFMHPELLDMISYAVRADIGPVGLTTNGSMMNTRLAQMVIDTGLFVVDISLDAARRETFENIRKGLNYEQVIKNVETLIDLRNQAKSKLKIMVSYVKQEGNLQEVDEFKKLWKSRADKVLIREMVTNVNQTPRGVLFTSDKQERWPCVHWFRRIVVNYDGMLKACPIDWTNGTAYKHLNETSIAEAWRSDYFSNNRKEHLTNCYSESSICKNCPDWQGTPWDMGYEKVIKTLQV